MNNVEFADKHCDVCGHELVTNGEFIWCPNLCTNLDKALLKTAKILGVQR